MDAYTAELSALYRRRAALEYELENADTIEEMDRVRDAINKIDARIDKLEGN